MTHFHDGRLIKTLTVEPFYPMVSLVYFQFTFAAITLVLLAGSVLSRMNFKALMAFVPLWLLFSYTVGTFSLWGGGFLCHWGVIDYSGGYVIHLSLGIAGFNDMAPYVAIIIAPIAVLNTNICAATSFLVWTSLDVVFFCKPSVIRVVQGMMTGLACITLGVGLVQSWAAILMGILYGSIPWVSMMVLHKKFTLLQKIKDGLHVEVTMKLQFLVQWGL
ncbi:hypothetical protein C1H46_019035 [Malus baccata]|uniref:Ammonium transporter AmtB-like domain-containing protein n=1 Tax=Malus baccata TaxID=106549 RepID=A0A540MA60_MALBA|nr:hypothetical protein C1H46_019035 [Malus baccata]